MNGKVMEINCDLGEGFGRWKVADDRALMKHITTANIATGFHASDPVTMRETVKAAVDHGLQIGAHTGLPDLLGFGRRRLALSPQEMRDYNTYQIGALKAFVEAEGGEVAHVKPHGVMYFQAYEDDELAEAVFAAVAEIDSSMLVYWFDTGQQHLADKYGLTLIPEGFPDLQYDDHGMLVIERVKRSWAPEVVADRAAQITLDGRIETDSGRSIPIEAETLCLHGDSSSSPEVLRAVKERLLAEGVAVRAQRPPRR
jgi:UPF0271 protein